MAVRLRPEMQSLPRSPPKQSFSALHIKRIVLTCTITENGRWSGSNEGNACNAQRFSWTFETVGHVAQKVNAHSQVARSRAIATRPANWGVLSSWPLRINLHCKPLPWVTLPANEAVAKRILDDDEGDTHKVANCWYGQKQGDCMQANVAQNPISKVEEPSVYRFSCLNIHLRIFRSIMLYAPGRTGGSQWKS